MAPAAAGMAADSGAIRAFSSWKRSLDVMRRLRASNPAEGTPLMRTILSCLSTALICAGVS